MFKQAVGFSIVLILLALVGLLLLPSPDVILSVSARSESVEYVVRDRTAAGIQMTNVQYIAGDSDPFSPAPEPVCLTARLLPAPGSKIRYLVNSDGEIGIDFNMSEQADTVGILEVQGQKAIKLTSRSQLLFSEKSNECNGEVPDVLPVWGFGSIGKVRTFNNSLEPEPGELVDGEVRITAKAIKRIWGIFPGAEGLYDAGIVALPTGGKLSNMEREDQAPWLGSARYSQSNGIPVFHINVSTESNTLWLYRSGLKQDSEPDPIGASAFVIQTRDPGIIRLQVILALMLIIVQTVVTIFQTPGAPLLSILKRHNENETKEVKDTDEKT